MLRIIDLLKGKTVISDIEQDFVESQLLKYIEVEYEEELPEVFWLSQEALESLLSDTKEEDFSYKEEEEEEEEEDDYYSEEDDDDYDEDEDENMYDERYNDEPISDELKNNGNTVNHIIYNVKITDDEISKILSETDFKNSVNIILTYNGHLFRKQIELGNKIYNLTGNLIAAAVRNPYDLALINENAARIATFGFRKNNMTALFELIAGKIAAQGKLPVSFEKVKL